LLAPHQGFWLKANAPAPDVVAPVASRDEGASPPLYRSGSPPAVVALRAEAEVDGAARTGQAFVMLSDEGALGHDALDAYELAPFAASYLTVSTASVTGD